MTLDRCRSTEESTPSSDKKRGRPLDSPAKTPPMRKGGFRSLAELRVDFWKRKHVGAESAEASSSTGFACSDVGTASGYDKAADRIVSPEASDVVAEPCCDIGDVAASWEGPPCATLEGGSNALPSDEAALPDKERSTSTDRQRVRSTEDAGYTDQHFQDEPMKLRGWAALQSTNACSEAPIPRGGSSAGGL
eukprot:TRINITY_DN9618_c0_g1_i5.p1 TRINITY_DN9618_c0_g1~~TRINITY_DN9618_c0_g1_i5.p1  ORF type:complete len:192 (+),score=22.80 TRINITY_DN9618_c0_g1_i5:144-719(+)